MSKHTPGPWNALADGAAIRMGRKCSAAITYSNGPPAEETAANTLLMAAAPDLLQLLRIALDVLDDDDPDSGASEWVLLARAAIAKAEGT